MAKNRSVQKDDSIASSRSGKGFLGQAFSSAMNAIGKIGKRGTDIVTKQVTALPSELRSVYPHRTKTTDLLSLIVNTQDKFKCVEIITEQTPDGQQALNTYLRLAHQGVSMKFHNARTGEVTSKYDREARVFCANMNHVSAGGLDALIDQLHESAITRGGMACEVVVAPDAMSIDEVVIVDPSGFSFEWNDQLRRYEIYQDYYTTGRGRDRVDLNTGNFLFIPFQPKVGHPDGKLAFEATIIAIEHYYKLLEDSLTVLNRIGYPRYDVAIDRKALLESALPEEIATPEKIAELFNREFDRIETSMRSIGKDNDILHFDSTKVTPLGAGANGSGIDVRAWFEAFEPMIANAFKLTNVLMNRLDGGSYSLGTVEFRIVTDTVDSMRRSSKRIIEKIMDMWARVNGYNVYCVVEHNPIDWEKELDKIQAQLLNMQKNRRAEEYGWIDHDTAAQNGVGAVNAADDHSAGRYEFLKTQAKTAADNKAGSSDGDEDDADSSKATLIQRVTATTTKLTSRFRREKNG